jgi:membrane protein DedA with SNARE-associated domain
LQESLSTLLLGGALFADATDGLTQLLEHAFYPTLLLIFIVASLGIPIPEDLPLIAAGVILRTHPSIASWTGTFVVSGIGIMSGDMILYTLGRRWGRDVFAHRSVSWLITPARFESLSTRFRRHGVWMVFFGRLFVGVRAAMCLTAGVTHFPFYRFFLADLAGAAMSIPVFVSLGYVFAGMIPTLRSYLSGAQAVLAVLLAVGVGLFIAWEVRRHRRARAAEIATASRIEKLVADPAHDKSKPALQPADAARLRDSAKSEPCSTSV